MVVGNRKTEKAPPARAIPEWRLQAAAVRRLRHLPEFGRRFDLAGDMNAGKRSPQQQVIGLATGMTRGEPDLRIYVEGGRCRLIEMKGPKGRLTPDQRERHARLVRLGFDVVTIKATTETEAADLVEAQARLWLDAANDNACT